MKNIKKLLVLSLIVSLAFVFAGCTKTDEEKISFQIELVNNDEEVVETKEFKVSKSESLFDVLIKNFNVVYTESQYGPYITEVNDLKADNGVFIAVYENNIITEVGISELIIDDGDVFSFREETYIIPTQDKSYTVNIYDIDGELLGNKIIKIEDDKKLIDGLLENFDVKYTVGDYGSYITSINNSICDNNYFLSLYENGESSMVGVDSVEINDEDIFDFKVECWNSALDSIELSVDKIIYSFMKNSIDNVLIETNPDYNLLSAIKLMMKYGYDNRIFNTNVTNKDKYIELFSKNYSEVKSIGELFKGAIGVDFYSLTNETLFNQINNITDKNSVLNIYACEYYLVACYKMNINNEVYNDVASDFIELINNASMSDSTCTCLQVMGMYKDETGYSEVLNKQIENLKVTITSNGVNEAWAGLNCSSTAQAILALVANGINPRDINDYDLISSILKYEVSNNFKNKIDSVEPNFLFDTPQAIAALLTYKVYRDQKLNGMEKAIILFDN